MLKFRKGSRKGFVKENSRIVAAEAILAILLVLMFQYIMGQRREYIDASREPDQTENRITVEGESIFSQQVTCEKDTLDGIMVLSETTEAGIDGALSVQIYEESDGLLAQAAQPLSDEGYTFIRLGETLSGRTGKKLELVLRSDTGEAVVLKGGSCEEVLVNEEDNACIRLVYHALDVGRYKISVYLWGGILWLVLSVCLIILQKKNGKPEYLFAFLYLSLGILYMCINPLYGVPDESAHFARTYGISEGSFVTEGVDGGIGTGSRLPENLLYGNKGPSMKIGDIAAGKDVELSDQKVFMDYWTSALYSPFTYTAQVLGVAVGKLVSNKVFFIAYCGRFAAWLAAGCILFFAIRYIPFGKHTLIAVSLLPMNMHESISLAGDTFTFAVAVAFFAFVLYLRYTKKGTMGRKDYVLLYVLLFFIASCKIVYVPLCMLAFLIPAERFGSKRNYGKHVLLAALEVLLTACSWLAISMHILDGQLNGKSAEQVQYLLSHPLLYVETVVNTTVTYGEGLVKSMLGSSLGWLSIAVNSGIIAMVAVNLAYVCVFEKGVWKDEESKWPRVWTIGAVACVVFVMYTSLYVQWTELEKNIIDGLQGRYFLPVLFPFLLSLKNGSKRTDGGTDRNGFYVSYQVLLITNLFTLVTLLTHYII
ncbi:MAG: DUF2142 domain-containing protein [Eubacterium sp.]|nr:DUF2142 domain-containing protein [Eubacterium sp.]